MASVQRSKNRKPSRGQEPLKFLLTNGRFPVSLDLARQLNRAGHTVYCVDPLGYPISKFSRAVKASAQIPAPRKDPHGYVRAVEELAVRWSVDVIVPIHEEVFVLADSDEPEILRRLFAPPFETLVRLHDRYLFAKYMESLDLAVPRTWLCKSVDDVTHLPIEKYANGMALKPCLRSAIPDVHHLTPGDPLPDDLDIGDHNWYVAQDWMIGTRYCSYSIIQNGSVEATGVYPVLETGAGKSTTYFRQKFHPEIYDYIHKFVTSAPPFTGQLAFEFIETADGVVAIECNSRSTSGVHLWCNTPWLARAITRDLPKEDIERPIRPPRKTLGHETHYQVAAGMLMWQHRHSSFMAWARHVKRLVFTRDVIWDWRDPMPTIAQPFLLTEYYRMARSKGIPMPALLQEQLMWQPEAEQLAPIRGMLVSSESDSSEKVDVHEMDA